jgi:uncharacterized protein DUF5670
MGALWFAWPALKIAQSPMLYVFWWFSAIVSLSLAIIAFVQVSAAEIRRQVPSGAPVHKRTVVSPVTLYDTSDRKEITVLSTLIVVLVLLWLLGITTSYTLGGMIHILLVIAILVVLMRVIQGRNPLRG